MKRRVLDITPDYTLKDATPIVTSKPFKFDHLKEMRTLLNAANDEKADREWEDYKLNRCYKGGIKVLHTDKRMFYPQLRKTIYKFR